MKKLVILMFDIQRKAKFWRKLRNEKQRICKEITEKSGKACVIICDVIYITKEFKVRNVIYITKVYSRMRRKKLKYFHVHLSPDEGNNTNL